MVDTLHILRDGFRQAVTGALGAEHAGADPLVRPSASAKFGDYQANAAMSLAKRAGVNPRELAAKLAATLGLDAVCERVEVAGPGFINLTLRDGFITDQLAAMSADAYLGVARAAPPVNVVVDYSGPNVAKQMHVGHLRSTVIGDAIARVLEFQGHKVTRQNHVGDWGTQFGMLIELLEEQQPGAHRLEAADLTELYKAAKQRFDSDPEFAGRARDRVVALQSGDRSTRGWWRVLVTQSAQDFNRAYRRLDVLLSDDDLRGESFYNDRLPGVIDDLGKLGVLEESQGARVVFPAGFSDREGDRLPLIVQKTDGGYLYATTDLAAARYRIESLGASRLVYVTDARQSQHFAMVFSTLRAAGWAGDSIRLDHTPFGTVLGPDRRPFKTRSGETVKLSDLLDEAESRAQAIVDVKNPELTGDDRRRIAHTIGIGALKYADLASDRIKDYVFDWDRMLAFEGNTAPYLQNAYVRVRSIFRKGGVDLDAVGVGAFSVEQPAERTLGVKLLQLPAVVESVADSLEPHRLCTYLYEVASTFHQFYEHCPVLTAPDEATRDHRLRLCALTARTLRQGLDLLGIGVMDRM